MRVSAVVLSYNSVLYLERCVRNLVNALQASDEEDEIWVVENGSSDNSAELLKDLEKEFPKILHPIYCDQNYGTTKARNMVLRQCTGRYLLLLDSDAEILVETLEKLIEVIDRDPICGIVAPRLIYPDGRQQISTDVFPTIGQKLRRFFALKLMEEVFNQQPPTSELQIVDYATSAVWMFPRKVLMEVGYLDENIFYSPEDVDYCIRVWAAGYRIVYDPSVYAIHAAQELSRGRIISRFTVSHALGLLYLFRKHRYALSRKRLYERIGCFGHAGRAVSGP